MLNEQLNSNTKWLQLVGNRISSLSMLGWILLSCGKVKETRYVLMCLYIIGAVYEKKENNYLVKMIGKEIRFYRKFIDEVIFHEKRRDDFTNIRVGSGQPTSKMNDERFFQAKVCDLFDYYGELLNFESITNREYLANKDNNIFNEAFREAVDEFDDFYIYFSDRDEYRRHAEKFRGSYSILSGISRYSDVFFEQL